MVCKLEFKVIESQDSEDFEDDSPFILEDAAEEGMLSMRNARYNSVNGRIRL